MTAFVTPTSFLAGKIVNIGGTVYQPGDAVTWAALKGVRNISSLVSSRRLVPVGGDQWNRHGRIATPTPSDQPALVIKENAL